MKRLTVLGLFAFHVFLLVSCFMAGAQEFKADTLSLQVYFRRGESAVDAGYRDNGHKLEQLRDMLERYLSDSSAVVRNIVIRTTASPEGPYKLNRQLAEERASSIDTFLVNNLYLDRTLFRYDAVGEDWEGLAKAIRDITLPWRDEALDIIQNTPLFAIKNGKTVEERKQQLMQLQGGEAWKWLDENVFPDLRGAAGDAKCIIYRPMVKVEKSKDTLYLQQSIIDTVYVQTQIPVIIEGNARGRKDYNLDGKKMLMALRTNLLAVPLANIGMEIPLGERWSVGADWYYPWLWRRNHGEGLDYQGVCFELLAGDAEIRYWFPRKGKKAQQRLLGHSIGVYGAGGYYDFERNWTGHQGWFYNIGVDYLFAMPIFRGRMHLEFELGVGYIYSPSQPYDTFVAGDKAYRRAGVTQFTRWFGPTRAQISLVVPIYVKKKEVAND